VLNHAEHVGPRHWIVGELAVLVHVAEEGTLLIFAVFKIKPPEKARMPRRVPERVSCDTSPYRRFRLEMIEDSASWRRDSRASEDTGARMMPGVG
jgi:hypothetical protein